MTVSASSISSEATSDPPTIAPTEEVILSSSTLQTGNDPDNIGLMIAVTGCIAAGVGSAFALIVWCFMCRKGSAKSLVKSENKDVEEGLGMTMQKNDSSSIRMLETDDTANDRYVVAGEAIKVDKAHDPATDTSVVRAESPADEASKVEEGVDPANDTSVVHAESSAVDSMKPCDITLQKSNSAESSAGDEDTATGSWHSFPPLRAGPPAEEEEPGYDESDTLGSQVHFELGAPVDEAGEVTTGVPLSL